MIQFADPLYLLLLPLVPLLAWWWLRQSRNALRYPATTLLAGLPRGRASFARVGGATLRGLTPALLVVGLARPMSSKVAGWLGPPGFSGGGPCASSVSLSRTAVTTGNDPAGGLTFAPGAAGTALKLPPPVGFKWTIVGSK